MYHGFPVLIPPIAISCQSLYNAHKEITKGNGGYFFTFLSRKGKEVGTMTLYDMLSLLIIATGFMLAINKK